MSVQELVERDPDVVAQELVAAHGGDAWLDEFAAALDRARAGEELRRVLATWGLNQSEAAALFGVTRQAVSKWLKNGVPSDRVEAIADLAAATDLLTRYLKRDRISAVVRREAPALGGKSLVDLVAEGRTREVLDASRAMFAFDRAAA